MNIDTHKTYLKTVITRSALEERGITEKRWLIEKLGMSHNAGDLLLRRGMLPANPDEALRVLKLLSKLSGLKINEMIFSIVEEAA